MKTTLKQLAKKFDITLLILFGSQVTGLTHSESDVDLAYSRKKELTLKQELEFRQIAQKGLKKNIDLVFIPRANPLLLNEITSKGKLLSGTNPQFLKLKIYSLKRFLDFEPYFKLQGKAINNHLKNAQ